MPEDLGDRHLQDLLVALDDLRAHTGHGCVALQFFIDPVPVHILSDPQVNVLCALMRELQDLGCIFPRQWLFIVDFAAGVHDHGAVKDAERLGQRKIRQELTDRHQ